MSNVKPTKAARQEGQDPTLASETDPEPGASEQGLIWASEGSTIELQELIDDARD